MKKIILLNNINFDGMGDFSHFVDIYYEFKKNPTYKDYEFISVVYTDSRYEQVEERLKKLNLPNCTLLNQSYASILVRGHPLLQDFAEAEQIIEISHDGFPWRIWYGHVDSQVWHGHVNCQVPYKFIGEHESNTTTKYYGAITRESYPMGLSEGRLGIKLAQKSRLQPVDAISVISQHDPHFVTQLIRASASASIEDFCKKNLLIPAYFNFSDAFLRFLLLMAINDDFPKDKHIAVYVSGMGDAAKFYQSFEKSFSKDCELFMHSDIKQIEVAQAGEETAKVYPLTTEGHRIIRLFNGFNLSDSAYDALYQQALFCGVSGDNTFERAVSYEVLPFYLSTNDGGGKNATRYALSRMIEKLDIPEPAKLDLCNFFRDIRHFTGADSSRSAPDGLGAFKGMHLTAMIEAWPTVSAYLKKNHNFYDKLGSIFFDSYYPASRHAMSTRPK